MSTESATTGGPPQQPRPVFEGRGRGGGPKVVRDLVFDSAN
jgi:hypothetical protein